jgi:hypothetical protein
MEIPSVLAATLDANRIWVPDYGLTRVDQEETRAGYIGIGNKKRKTFVFIKGGSQSLMNVTTQSR